MEIFKMLNNIVILAQQAAPSAGEQAGLDRHASYFRHFRCYDFFHVQVSEEAGTETQGYD